MCCNDFCRWHHVSWAVNSCAIAVALNVLTTTTKISIAPLHTIHNVFFWLHQWHLIFPASIQPSDIVPNCSGSLKSKIRFSRCTIYISSNIDFIHWCLAPHIYTNTLDRRCQTFTWTNSDALPVRPLKQNWRKLWAVKILNKLHLKTSFLNAFFQMQFIERKIF